MSRGSFPGQQGELPAGAGAAGAGLGGFPDTAAALQERDWCCSAPLPAGAGVIAHTVTLL